MRRFIRVTLKRTAQHGKLGMLIPLDIIKSVDELVDGSCAIVFTDGESIELFDDFVDIEQAITPL